MQPVWDPMAERVTPWGVLLLSCMGVVFLSVASAVLTFGFLETDHGLGAQAMFGYAAFAGVIAMAAGLLWGLGLSGWRRQHAT